MAIICRELIASTTIGEHHTDTNISVGELGVGVNAFFILGHRILGLTALENGCTNASSLSSDSSENNNLGLRDLSTARSLNKK